MIPTAGLPVTCWVNATASALTAINAAMASTNIRG